MRKFHIKDEDGEIFEVEELDEDVTEDPKVKDEETLTEEEIMALKGLAAVAEKLMNLVKETTDEDKTCDEDETHDEDELNDEDEEIEEVIDTDEKDVKKTKDSRRSFGAIERTRKTNDSLKATLDIESAWEKRYNGGK